jgi:hypothetical protein
MGNWTVSCLTCQEPVGKPVWPQGCLCDEPMTDTQQALLAVINNAWDAIEWEATDG